MIKVLSPQVMGILNITPDSFCEVGRFQSPVQALQHARQMVSDGALIIDIGAEPTNPSLNPHVSLQEELDRLLPVIELLVKELDVVLSVDTSKPEVMNAVVKLGVGLINDVRALRVANAVQTVAALKVPVCLMHMFYPDGREGVKTPPMTDEQDIVSVVKNFLRDRIKVCEAAGIPLERIIIDPGIGHGNFGKNLPQNLILLKRLAEFKELGAPILLGVSRKTFIGELLNIPVSERLPASLAAAVVGVLNGAAIVRTHDVRETVQALKVATAITRET